jgi:CrcB protein
MGSVFAICIGASVGALVRWGLALWLTPGGVIPWGNAGGLSAGRLPDRRGDCGVSGHAADRSGLQLLLVTGFPGGLTTFSTFSAEVVTYLLEARYGLATGVALIHVTGSLLMTVAGIRSATFFIAINIISLSRKSLFT